MINKLQENNYLIVDSFISEKEAQELYDQFKLDIENYPKAFRNDEQCPKSLAIYNYRPFLELLVNKTYKISELIGEPVLPTYCYSRLYKKGEELLKHTDRPSCEISITLNIGGDKDWEIFFTKPNGEVVSVNLKPGQCAIYLGMISEHWREKFKGKEYGQVFLHYVRSRGEYWTYCFDKGINT
jgi:hypothetical protein